MKTLGTKLIPVILDSKYNCDTFLSSVREFVGQKRFARHLQAANDLVNLV